MVTERAPTAAEMRALLFGWKVCKHVKSNAIVFAREGQTVGVGAGQMSRVDSVKIAVIKAATNGLELAGSVVASDAFFPFPDGVEEAGKAGATAVIQPGGSVRDADVIAAANKLGMAMVFTGSAALPPLELVWEIFSRKRRAIFSWDGSRGRNWARWRRAAGDDK